MSVSMNSVFSGGWKNIKENPILFIPNILLFILSTVLLIAIGIVFIIVFPDGLDVLVNSYSEFLVNADVDSLISSWSEFIVFFFLAGSIYLFIYVLLTIYVQAGLIGMSQDVAKTGETKFSKMFFYGNKYFFRSFFASILVALIILIPVCLLYLILIVGLIFVISLSSSLAALFIILLFFLMLLFLLVMIAYLIIASLYLYFVLYAVVIDNLSVIASIRKSISLFKENKGDVIIFFLVIMAISIGVGMISSVFSYLGIIPVIGVIFYILYLLITIITSTLLSAMITVWETRMYLELTGNGCLDGENEAGWSNETYEEQNTDTDF